jgi:hypothetical protein
MLNVNVLRAITLKVHMLSVVMLSVVAPGKSTHPYTLQVRVVLLMLLLK